MASEGAETLEEATAAPHVEVDTDLAASGSDSSNHNPLEFSMGSWSDDGSFEPAPELLLKRFAQWVETQPDKVRALRLARALVGVLCVTSCVLCCARCCSRS